MFLVLKMEKKVKSVPIINHWAKINYTFEMTYRRIELFAPHTVKYVML